MTAMEGYTELKKLSYIAPMIHVGDSGSGARPEEIPAASMSKRSSGTFAKAKVETVLVVFPRHVWQTRPGKRLAGGYFLDHCREEGTHGCNYLLTVNIEMDPVDGFQARELGSGPTAISR